MSETAILGVVNENFKDHLILGEEGGLIGDASSDYLWCIDPLGWLPLYSNSLEKSVTCLKYLLYTLTRRVYS